VTPRLYDAWDRQHGAIGLGKRVQLVNGMLELRLRRDPGIDHCVRDRLERERAQELRLAARTGRLYDVDLDIAHAGRREEARQRGPMFGSAPRARTASVYHVT